VAAAARRRLKVERTWEGDACWKEKRKKSLLLLQLFWKARCLEGGIPELSGRRKVWAFDWEEQSLPPA